MSKECSTPLRIPRPGTTTSPATEPLLPIQAPEQGNSVLTQTITFCQSYCQGSHPWEGDRLGRCQQTHETWNFPDSLRIGQKLPQHQKKSLCGWWICWMVPWRQNQDQSHVHQIISRPLHDQYAYQTHSWRTWERFFRWSRLLHFQRRWVHG